MDITIQPRKIFFILLSIIGVLTALNFVGIAITQYADLPKVEEHLVRIIDFDKERNIPAFYSSLAILCASIILACISRAEKSRGGDSKRWMGLSVLFLFLALDEAVSIHELLSGPTRTLMDLDGALYLAWVVPYSLLVVGLVFIYGKFLFNLPFAIRVLFVLSGVAFVSGAVGLELLGSNYHYIGNAGDPGYALLYTMEELLEMLGVAIFVYGLLFYFQTELSGYSLRLSIQKMVAENDQGKAKKHSANGTAVPAYSGGKTSVTTSEAH